MWQRETFAELVQPPIIGMVHLAALPGAPRYNGDTAAVQQAALADAQALVAGGIGAIMVENFHDVPFHPGPVPPETIAAMTVIISAIRGAFPALPLGVNVLRNDAHAALAIAVACQAQMIRVNVHTGAAVTDQGTIMGVAHQTLRLRRQLGVEVGILADVRVKHARPLVERPLAEEAADLRMRGLADAVIVTGVATGATADPEQLQMLRAALPDCPLLIGSGVNENNLADFVPQADGFIVGTSLQKSGEGRATISTERTSRLISALTTADVDRKSRTQERERP